MWRDVKAAHKALPCAHCRCTIEVGQPARVCTGKTDDGFWSTRAHPECFAASQANAAETPDEDRWLYELYEPELDDLQADHWIAVGYVRRARAFARMRSAA